jgi:hypothetical protein
MNEKVKELFGKARLLYSREDFLVVGIPAVANVAIGGEGFSAVIKETGETTLIVPVEKWAEIEPTVKGAKVEGPFRVLTFDVPLEWTIVGFMAEVSKLLAAEGISIGAVSAFTHDHFLVKTADAEKAVKAIEKVLLEHRGEKPEAEEPAKEGEEKTGPAPPAEEEEKKPEEGETE